MFWRALAILLLAGVALSCRPQKVKARTPGWQAINKEWMPEGVAEVMAGARVAEEREYEVVFGNNRGRDTLWVWPTSNGGKVMHSQLNLGAWQRSLWLTVDSTMRPGAGGERWQSGNKECVRKWQEENNSLKVFMYTRDSAAARGPSRTLTLSLPEKGYIDIASPAAAEWGVAISVPLTEATPQVRTGGCPGWDKIETGMGIFPSILRLSPSADASTRVLTRWRLADAGLVAPDSLIWERSSGKVIYLATSLEYGLAGRWTWKYLPKP